jgi:hypothetical protein
MIKGATALEYGGGSMINDQIQNIQENTVYEIHNQENDSEMGDNEENTDRLKA